MSTVTGHCIPEQAPYRVGASSRTTARLYVRDAAGREVKEHPLHGAAPAALPGWHPVLGPGFRAWVEASYWDASAGCYIQRIFTAADFAGSAVTVRLWAPNPEVRSTWNLVPLEGNS